ncbi:hypothetical protein GCM10020218_089890 [Dactylosporangium vinaceum]
MLGRLGGMAIKGSSVRRLTPDDVGPVTVLQRCCWVDEAIVNETLAIPALHETLDDVRRWLGEWDTIGLWLDGRLLTVTTRTGDEYTGIFSSSSLESNESSITPQDDTTTIQTRPVSS